MHPASSGASPVGAGRGEDEQSAFAVAALARYPVTAARVTRAYDSYNTVYRVRADEGDYMLRVGTSPTIHHADAPSAEETWTARFAGAGLTVPRVVRTVDGDNVVMDPNDAARRAMLLTWVPGSPPDHPMKADLISDLGGLSARMHAASPPTRTRPHGVLDASEPLLFEIPDVLHTAPEPVRELLILRATQARDWISDLWDRADEAPRVLHFDLTPRNVVMGPGGLTAIDFQDLAWGQRTQDVGNTLYGITRGAHDQRTLEQFRLGYERHAPWPNTLDAPTLERLFVARRIMMVNLALTLRRPGLDEYIQRHAAVLART